MASSTSKDGPESTPSPGSSPISSDRSTDSRTSTPTEQRLMADARPTQSLFDHVQAGATEGQVQDDATARRYGMITDLLINGADDRTRRDHLQRYNNRRTLAELARVPEGFRYQYPTVTGATREIIVLSPPALIAHRNSDGTWRRRVRTVEDGEAPYSEDWYRDYLRSHDLPSFFLSPLHIGMLDDEAPVDVSLLEAAEGLEANQHGVLPEIQHPAPNYLEMTYPGARYAQGQSRPVWTVFTQENIITLSYWCPATQVNLRGWHTVIMPDGRLRFQRDVRDAIARPPTRIVFQRWPIPAALTSYTNSAVGLSAQVFSQLSTHPAQATGSRVQPPVLHETEDFTAARTEAWAHGFVVDPSHQPNGLGTWTWLRDADRVAAETFDLHTPQDVMDARATGPQDLDHIHIAWYHDQRFVRLQDQPHGAGSWEFLTVGPGSDEAIAQMNLNGSDRITGPTPTPGEVWRIRQEDENDPTILYGGVTDGISLVWVPEEDPTLADLEQEEMPDYDEETSEDSDDQQVTHDPLNGGQPGGDHDQTNTSKRVEYSTFEHTFGRGAKRGTTVVVTVDRSNVQRGTPEPHKLWAFSKTDWRRWDRASELTGDWMDRKLVEALNKWRDQHYRRLGQSKRGEGRTVYTDEELDWLFQVVIQTQGRRPTETFASIMQRFNAHFGTERGEKAIESILNRLRNEYNDHGGQRKPDRKKRGQNMREMAIKRREAKASTSTGTTLKTPAKITLVLKKRKVDGGDDDMSGTPVSKKPKTNAHDSRPDEEAEVEDAGEEGDEAEDSAGEAEDGVEGPDE